jgi:hypothetical protein
MWMWMMADRIADYEDEDEIPLGDADAVRAVDEDVSGKDVNII